MADGSVVAAALDSRRAIDYLRRKARSVELQAARATPLLAVQLKDLAAAIMVEVQVLERSLAASLPTLQG